MAFERDVSIPHKRNQQLRQWFKEVTAVPDDYSLLLIQAARRSGHADFAALAVTCLYSSNSEKFIRRICQELKAADPAYLEKHVNDIWQRKEPEVISTLNALRSGPVGQSLTQQLMSEDPSVRSRAAGILSGMGWPPQSSALRAHFFVALGKMKDAAREGEVACRPLLKAARNKSISAAEAILSLGEHECDISILKALTSIQDEYVEVHWGEEFRTPYTVRMESFSEWRKSFDFSDIRRRAEAEIKRREEASSPS